MTDIFVSYSSNDKVKVSRLVAELKAEGASIWYDEEQIMPGDDLIKRMADGIDQSQYYIICLSPSFDKKPPTSWVKKEFRMAMIKEQKEGKQIIIPVRIKKGGSIPIEIGEKAYADLSSKVRWNRNFPKLCKALNL